MSNPHMRAAIEYERVRDAIMNDDDWMADDSIDDATLINALSEAAELRRAKSIEFEERAATAFESRQADADAARLPKGV